MEFDKLIIKFIWIVKGTKIVKIILKKNKIREIAHHISRVSVKEDELEPHDNGTKIDK